MGNSCCTGVITGALLSKEYVVSGQSQNGAYLYQHFDGDARASPFQLGKIINPFSPVLSEFANAIKSPRTIVWAK